MAVKDQVRCAHVTYWKHDFAGLSRWEITMRVHKLIWKGYRVKSKIITQRKAINILGLREWSTFFGGKTGKLTSLDLNILEVEIALGIYTIICFQIGDREFSSSRKGEKWVI